MEHSTTLRIRFDFRPEFISDRIVCQLHRMVLDNSKLQRFVFASCTVHVYLTSRIYNPSVWCWHIVFWCKGQMFYNLVVRPASFSGPESLVNRVRRTFGIELNTRAWSGYWHKLLCVLSCLDMCHRQASDSVIEYAFPQTMQIFAQSWKREVIGEKQIDRLETVTCSRVLDLRNDWRASGGA